ncbi:phosphoserine phosphatase [Blastomonas natatoria]|uniref:Phosphoserine phosphatase n=1 Tax=Blastomonas natatoria TaxID=34015 RepID=A0A2V3V2F7_9SPHN|nr:phosphoserine phosphatase [Blastomonas natatoria]
MHQAGLVVGESRWVEPGQVGELHFAGNRAAADAAFADWRDRADVLVLDDGAREARLLVSDMDSTMIANECIDELADYAGVKPQVAEITERAMQGELDFEAALRERVALLKGLSEHVIGDCLGHRIQPMPGARRLVRTLRSRGVDCVLVSGGFHSFADVIGAELGFNAVYANRLVIEHGHMTGALEGGIVDAARKAAILQEQAGGQGLESAQIIALGDGANDIPMLKVAGSGIAYHAKPAAIAAADAHIAHGDWTVLLHALGIPRSDWAE